MKSKGPVYRQDRGNRRVGGQQLGDGLWSLRQVGLTIGKEEKCKSYQRGVAVCQVQTGGSERGGCVSAADRGGRGSVKNQHVGRLRKLTLMMKVMNM